MCGNSNIGMGYNDIGMGYSNICMHGNRNIGMGYNDIGMNEYKACAFTDFVRPIKKQFCYTTCRVLEWCT